MQRRHTDHDKPPGVLDALASRIGICLSVGFLLLVCIAAAFYTQSVVKQLSRTHAVFEDRQIRNGYVAMSDIQRLLLVAQEAAYVNEMTPKLAAEFAAASDFVYVRAAHLNGILAKGAAVPAQQAAMAQLNAIVEIADAALVDGFSDLDGLVADLLLAAEAARGHLVRFLDEMRRQADEVMLKQTRVVSKQQIVVLISLGCLTFVGSIALVLLRLEVLGRRARDRAEERVQFLAFFDPLTSLPNRVQFQDRLQEMLENKNRPVALLSIDLDAFKDINDTHGHAAGDVVLKNVGETLAGLAGPHHGFASRLAGDEFAMVVPMDDPRRLAELCTDILESCAKPIELEGETLAFSVSIGVATSTQASGVLPDTVDALSRVSDFALYASKDAGRNRFTIYDQTLEQRFLERRAMLNELPHAIAAGALEVYLQPKVDLPAARVFGFEALVRWRRNGEIVQPDEFILLAEESGLVIEIDRFVLNTAAKLMADWNHTHQQQLSVSVNLSSLHFTSHRILRCVEHALWRTDIRPDLLTLEITESTEMRDWDQARFIISRLRKMGCKIAIDDFGTGFSSLAYLRSMEADELKIDRSLLAEIEVSEKARLMLASVFEIAQNLELDVTVEGIETELQAEIIHKMGGLRAQGFLFGRPSPSHIALEATRLRPVGEQQDAAG
jgi:diguanylate cyclase (GGDEF)-like protein